MLRCKWDHGRTDAFGKKTRVRVCGDRRVSAVVQRRERRRTCVRVCVLWRRGGARVCVCASIDGLPHKGVHPKGVHRVARTTARPLFERRKDRRVSLPRLAESETHAFGEAEERRPLSPRSVRDEKAWERPTRDESLGASDGYEILVKYVRVTKAWESCRLRGMWYVQDGLLEP